MIHNSRDQSDPPDSPATNQPFRDALQSRSDRKSRDWDQLKVIIAVRGHLIGQEKPVREISDPQADQQETSPTSGEDHAKDRKCQTNRRKQLLDQVQPAQVSHRLQQQVRERKRPGAQVFRGTIASIEIIDQGRQNCQGSDYPDLRAAKHPADISIKALFFLPKCKEGDCQQHPSNRIESYRLRQDGHPG